jgi:hypothetical protein
MLPRNLRWLLVVILFSVKAVQEVAKRFQWLLSKFSSASVIQLCNSPKSPQIFQPHHYGFLLLNRGLEVIGQNM